MASVHPAIVSVVILNWNAKDILRECIVSVKRSDYPIHEIIVVDNASIDGSAAMVREFFSDVVLIENKVNLGAPEGRNIGISRAIQKDVKYVYTLDNDLTIAPTTIFELVSLMEQEPDIGCAGSIIYYHDKPDRIFSAGQYIDWTQNLVRTRAANKKDNGQLAECAEVDYVGTGAMMTQKSVFTQIGLLDAGFIGYGYEDTDFGLRTRRAGYRVVCFTRSRVWHRPFTGIGKYSFKKKYLEARNAIRFARIYGTPRNWIKFLFYSVAGLFYAALREGSRGNIMGVVGKARGLYDGLRGKEDFARTLLKSHL
jgi:GT2 family glycosyltransferase